MSIVQSYYAYDQSVPKMNYEFLKSFPLLPRRAWNNLEPGDITVKSPFKYNVKTKSKSAFGRTATCPLPPFLTGISDFFFHLLMLRNLNI